MKKSTRKSKSAKKNNESEALVKTESQENDTPKKVTPVSKKKTSVSKKETPVTKEEVPVTNSDDNTDYEVEQVVDMEVNMKRKCPIKFRVRWVGYGEKDDSWLLATELSCESLMNDFLEVSGRQPEYEKALAAKQKPDAIVRVKRAVREKIFYSELAEDEEEVLPSGTRSRKTAAQKRKWVEPKHAKHSSKKMKVGGPKKGKTVMQTKASEEYEVENIIAKRESHGKIQYKVRWNGYAAKFDSWLNKRDLYCSNLINKFEDEESEEEKGEYDEEEKSESEEEKSESEEEKAESEEEKAESEEENAESEEEVKKEWKAKSGRRASARRC